MSTVITYLNYTFAKLSFPFKVLAHLIPTRLPQGRTAFDAWANDILNTYRLPNNDSTHFALATMIMYLEPTAAFRPKIFFVLKCWKGAASEVASAVIQEMKEKQQQAAKAALDVKKD